jgi:hypothetical protein
MGWFDGAKSWVDKTVQEARDKAANDKAAKDEKHQQLANAGFNGEQQRLIMAADFALVPGENIVDITNGKVDGDWTTLAVTDQRVFLHSKRFGGDNVQDFAYGLLTSCDYKTGWGHRPGSITLVAAGNATTVADLKSDETKRLGPVIRNRMAMAHNSAGPQVGGGTPGNGIAQAAPVADDPAEQLRKLARLHDDKLITDEEFQAKRTEIMNRL